MSAAQAQTRKQDFCGVGLAGIPWYLLWLYGALAWACLGMSGKRRKAEGGHYCLPAGFCPACHHPPEYHATIRVPHALAERSHRAVLLQHYWSICPRANAEHISQDDSTHTLPSCSLPAPPEHTVCICIDKPQSRRTHAKTEVPTGSVLIWVQFMSQSRLHSLQEPHALPNSLYQAHRTTWLFVISYIMSSRPATATCTSSSVARHLLYKLKNLVGLRLDKLKLVVLYYALPPIRRPGAGTRPGANHTPYPALERQQRQRCPEGLTRAPACYLRWSHISSSAVDSIHGSAAPIRRSP